MDRFEARGYQLEMLEQSLQENIILVMDTGSGKTHVYVGIRLELEYYENDQPICRASMRITAELQRCSEEKIVWFLAPTVALSSQQKEAIESHIPPVNIRLLIGEDGVDRWSEQRIWDAALRDIRVVVSTHAVLADALTHGFVKIEKIALLVFDEAHHCVKNHPGNRIMRDFYRPTKDKRGAQAVPHILGLTASPIMRSKVTDIRKIESNLHAVSRTPQLQRQELLRYVHRPHLALLIYPESISPISSGSVPSLRALFQLLPSSELTNGTTFGKLQGQLTRFYTKATRIYSTLGAWAADYFIIETSRRTVSQVEMDVNGLWVDQEKVRLAERLKGILDTDRVRLSARGAVSLKGNRLLSFLKQEHHKSFSGIIFVKERAAAYVLAALIAHHPLTRDVLRCAPCMGSTNRSKKQNLCDMLDPEGIKETLLQFQEGEKNLIVATDVLEEGIDLTACHVVICFDQPNNLKSFIQRRGRARQQESTFAIMVANDDTSNAVERWRELEEEMIRLYRDHERKLQEIENLETYLEDVPFQLRLPTGALLTADTAISHIHHFCTTLQSEPHVDLRPRFKIEKDRNDWSRATVILPSSVDQSLRVSRGTEWWLTERAASRDAAFQAYISLHRAKLVNDNFLPLSQNNFWQEGADGGYLLTPKIAIHEAYNPWRAMPMCSQHSDLYRYRVSIVQNGRARPDLAVTMITPVEMPETDPLTLYWDSQTTFSVSLEKLQVTKVSAVELELLRETTFTLLHSTRTKHPTDQDGKDFTILVTPDIPFHCLAEWLEANRGTRNCLHQYLQSPSAFLPGFVRSELLYNKPHQFVRWINPTDRSGLLMQCQPFPRRRNMLQPGTLSQKLLQMRLSHDQENFIKRIPASSSSFDLLPWEMSRVSLFLPPLMHQLQRLLVAARLREKILRQIPTISLGSLADAITCPSTQWMTNYQRLEYLGDGILKFAVCIQLFHDHPLWHEGYLSQRKSQIVSNATLTHATLRAGLELFLLTEPLTPRRWMIPMRPEPTSSSPVRREVSSKVLADILEALIGAAYVDGGMPLAWSMIHLFLANIPEQMPPIGNKLPDKNFITTPRLEEKIDRLVGRRFHDRSTIWEALTHPSWQRDLSTSSYQRLEFLGDSLLDVIITKRLYERTPTLTESEMTGIKAAMVNAHFLAFLCMELGLDDDMTCIRESEFGQFDQTIHKGRLELWKFMRHDSTEIPLTQQSCLKRYSQLCEPIRRHLMLGEVYPWAPLTQLGAEKFYSDIIESILGALFIDSQGNIEECEKFLARINMMNYLDRIVRNNVIVEHPRAVLNNLAGSKRVSYNISRNADKAVTYDVSVILGEEEMACVHGCLSKNECIVRGADLAIVKLRTSTSSCTANVAI